MCRPLCLMLSRDGEAMKIAFTVYGQPVGKARARVTSHGTYTPATTVELRGGQS